MLRQARQRQALTLTQMGDRIGVHNAYLSMLERGLKAPSTIMAALITEAYGLNQEQAGHLMSEAIPGVGRAKKAKAANAARG